jgi:glucose/arabinose dehydrogenase
MTVTTDPTRSSTSRSAPPRRRPRAPLPHAVGDAREKSDQTCANATGETPSSRRPLRAWIAALLILAAGAGGAGWWAQGRGYKTWVMAVLGLSADGGRARAGAAPARLPADPSIGFQQVVLTNAAGAGFTALQVGPDRRLYAGTDDGRVFRFPIRADATLGEPQVVTTLQAANGGPRLLTGFCFDPASELGRVTLWAAHGHYGFVDAPDFTGKITRLSGVDLEVAEDVVVHLPRSVRDHATNQPGFGPDGALYFPQGSNTAFGAPDDTWGGRPERPLSAAVLRLDVTKLTPGSPLDARTADAGGSYDPAAAGAPLTVHARGVRMAYDLLWHSNGRLYVPCNGSSAGGNTPASPDGAVPAIRNVPTSEHDSLFAVTSQGKYYGHPNPSLGHYVLNGGNPTPGPDPAEVPQYPAGTAPDPHYVPAAYDFGTHVSPNGIIEYRSNAFGGRLAGKVLVCRYNVGGDVLCLSLDGAGNVRGAHAGIPGFSGLTNPLDLADDPATGAVYVSEYGRQRITLLRPLAP